MICRFYEQSDYPELCQWMVERNTEMPPGDHLSEYGFFVPEIACIFLYLTGSKVAYLDHFVSNPKVSEWKRVQAYRLGLDQILTFCEDRKVQKLVGYTNLAAVVGLAKHFGGKGNLEPFFQCEIRCK